MLLYMFIITYTPHPGCQALKKVDNESYVNYLLPYKRSKYVIEVFNSLKQFLGIDEFKRLFEVILTDNGTEFSNPESIEMDINTGEIISNVFYCDPNCS